MDRHMGRHLDAHMDRHKWVGRHIHDIHRCTQMDRQRVRDVQTDRG